MSVRSDNAQFDWKDPFLMESQLSEEERLVRDTARQYAQEKLLPRLQPFAPWQIFIAAMTQQRRFWSPQ